MRKQKVLANCDSLKCVMKSPNRPQTVIRILPCILLLHFVPRSVNIIYLERHRGRAGPSQLFAEYLVGDMHSRWTKQTWSLPF